jgi:hypothetical protein
MQGAQVATEGQELGAALAGLDVPVEPVGGQVIAGEQVPDAMWAGVGGPASGAPRGRRVTLAGGRRRPQLARRRLQVQRPKLIETDTTVGAPGSGSAVSSAIA